MSKTSRSLVSMQKTALKGEVIPIRVIVQHDMESGFRHTERGVRIARDILREFVCTYDGVEVFRAQLYPAVGANPTFSFFTVATQTGTLEFKWTGDEGYAASVTSQLVVT